MKIKLVAIAKDEAAYISEWIFHHLHFGFDFIEVYSNNISDNTRELLSKFNKDKNVVDVNADYILGFSDQGFQRIAYGLSVEKARSEGFSHVMFLDIDEFWVPLDFKASIKEFLFDLGDPDIVSFPWALKIDDKNFSSPFDRVNKFRINDHVKTVFKTTTIIKKIYSHNIVTDFSCSILPDGARFSECGEHRPTMVEKYKVLPPAFISHRVCRGPIEYVSLLGRGRPSNTDSMFAIKDNRTGYLKARADDTVFEISDCEINHYNECYFDFIRKNLLTSEIEQGKEFVENRYSEVLSRIKNIDDSDLGKVLGLLRGVDIKEIKEILIEIKDRLLLVQNEHRVPDLTEFKNVLNVNDDVINYLRDEAIKYEALNPQIAISLISMALAFRPSGPFIQKKVEEMIAVRLKAV